MQIDQQRDYARTMRNNMTGAERKLWTHLRGRALAGFRFNRQEELGPYIVDFVCRESKVIVEVDGVTHGNPREVTADKRRTDYLENKGFRVFRVWNNDVYSNIDGVLDALLKFLEGRTR